MLNNKIVLVFICFLFAAQASGQDCNLTIKGNVVDEASSMPLAYVNVFMQETAIGTNTDDDGNFLLENVCEGEYHFIFSHIGCEPVKAHIEIYSDTLLHIILQHTSISFSDVVIKGKKGSLSDQPNLSVTRKVIEDNANQNLAGLLENESGIHLLKNGSGISKPVVHGLFGNRLTILNNGVAQSGQQWGNDHSPEIDPFAADNITVLKGASAIEYAGGNLGSVILVEPKRIEKEPHLHGQVNYTFESNGLGSNFNARVGKYSPQLAWRVNGTFKRYGDRKASSYYLKNTGSAEANFSLQLEKSWNENFFMDAYFSTFNTRLGVLRGSHIGNLTDLNEALVRDVPFYTEPDFSYDLDAPKQHVSHNLAKIKGKYFATEDKVLEFVFAAQSNDRLEFDLRRSGRTDIPALSLRQYTFNADFKYSVDFDSNWKFIIGNQNIFTDNTNNPETGIFPLIPDYLSWKNGVFSTLSKGLDRLQINLGARYDFEFQNVVTFTNSFPREVVRYDNRFHNFSGLFVLKYDLSNTQSIGLNTGYAMRNPAINELYSNGLHQGVSGIEEGDINLKTEKAVKNTLEYKWLPSANFSFNALAYSQSFKDYIFLNPQDKVRLTIRGAFPVFKYEQTDANIYGLDLSSQFTINNFLVGQLKYSYLKGTDTKNNTPLIFMPPNRVFGSLIYRVSNSYKLSKAINLEETEIEINNRYVFNQGNILTEQDFVAPPPSYNLFGLKLSTNIISHEYKVRCFIKADNLFNVKYRDYLNRQRYFADDLGTSIVVGVNFKF